MDVRVSVQAMIHQLIQEQARATTHLEGLQRDVSALLEFREHLLDSLPRTNPLEATQLPLSPATVINRPVTADRDDGDALVRCSSTSWKHRRKLLHAADDPDFSNVLGDGLSGGHHNLRDSRDPLTKRQISSAVDECDSVVREDVDPQQTSTAVSSTVVGASGGGGESGHSGGTSTSGVGTSVGAQTSGVSTSGGGGASSSDELLQLLEGIELRARRLQLDNHTRRQLLTFRRPAGRQASSASTVSPSAELGDVTLQCRFCQRPAVAVAAPSPAIRLSDDGVQEERCGPQERQSLRALRSQQQRSSPFTQRLCPARWSTMADITSGCSVPDLRESVRHNAENNNAVIEEGAIPAVATAGIATTDNSYGQCPLSGFAARSYHIRPTQQHQQHPSGGCVGCAVCDTSSTSAHCRCDDVMMCVSDVQRLIDERSDLIQRLLDSELMALRSHSQAASLQWRIRHMCAVNRQLRQHCISAESCGLITNHNHLNHYGCDGVQSARRLIGQSSRPLSASAATAFNQQQRRRVRQLAGTSTEVMRCRTSTDAAGPGGSAAGRSVSRIPQPLSLLRRPNNPPAKSAASYADAGIQTPWKTDATPRKTSDVCIGTDASPFRPAKATKAAVSVRLPSRDQVAAVLRITDPLQLQKQLLLLLVESETLRSQLNSFQEASDVAPLDTVTDTVSTGPPPYISSSCIRPLSTSQQELGKGIESSNIRDDEDSELAVVLRSHSPPLTQVTLGDPGSTTKGQQAQSRDHTAMTSTTRPHTASEVMHKKDWRGSFPLTERSTPTTVSSATATALPNASVPVDGRVPASQSQLIGHILDALANGQCVSSVNTTPISSTPSTTVVSTSSAGDGVVASSCSSASSAPVDAITSNPNVRTRTSGCLLEDGACDGRTSRLHPDVLMSDVGHAEEEEYVEEDYVDRAAEEYEEEEDESEEAGAGTSLEPPPRSAHVASHFHRRLHHNHLQHHQQRRASATSTASTSSDNAGNCNIIAGSNSRSAQLSGGANMEAHFGYKYGTRTCSTSSPSQHQQHQRRRQQTTTPSTSTVTTTVSSAVTSSPASGSAVGVVKESGNARVGRYIRSLLHRISESPDHH